MSDILWTYDPEAVGISSRTGEQVETQGIQGQIFNASKGWSSTKEIHRCKSCKRRVLGLIWRDEEGMLMDTWGFILSPDEKIAECDECLNARNLIPAKGESLGN